MITFIKPTVTAQAATAQAQPATKTQPQPQPQPQPPTVPRIFPRINIGSASNRTTPIPDRTDQQAKPDHAATQASVAELVTQATQTTPPPSDSLAKPAQDSKVSEEIFTALASLDAALETKAPGMAQYIAIIHKAMRDDPAQVVLMSDEERGIFFRGLKSVTQQEIIATTKGKRASKASGSISLDDI